MISIFLEMRLSKEVNPAEELQKVIDFCRSRGTLVSQWYGISEGYLGDLRVKRCATLLLQHQRLNRGRKPEPELRLIPEQRQTTE